MITESVKCMGWINAGSEKNPKTPPAIISIAKTSAGDNKFYATELTILIDGTDVNVSEYGTIDNDGNIGTISVSKVGSTVNITVTPQVGITPVTVRFARIGLKA